MNKQNYKNRSKIFFGILLTLIVVSFIQCAKMDDAYEKFWKDGERVYPAPVDTVTVHPGENRILMRIVPSIDPNVIEGRVFWNFKADSVVFPIESNRASDTLSVLLENMEERSYTFTVVTYDKKGNHSMPYDVIGNSYGPIYQESLLTRLLQSAEYKNGILTVNWGDNSEPTALDSEILYTDTSGNVKTEKVPRDQKKSTEDDFDFGADKTIKYRTFYLPEPLAIDTFYTDFQKFRVKGPVANIPRDMWSASASSFNDEFNDPSKAIDDIDNTFWFNAPNTSFPHSITIDMGEVIDGVDGIELLLRKRNEIPESMKIYVSKDGETWDLMGDYGVNYNDSAGKKTFVFPSIQTIRFFEVRVTKARGQTPDVAIYEIYAYTR